MNKPVEKILSARHFQQQADYHRAMWHEEVPNDTTLDDLLRPGFWANHARVLQRGALVDVVTEDYTLDVQLRVIDSGVGYVTMRVAMIREVPAEQAATTETEEPEVVPDIPEGYQVGFTKDRGHYVKVKANNEIVSQDHETKTDAIHAAVEHAGKAGRLAA